MHRSIPVCVVAVAMAIGAPARADDEAASTELFNAGRDAMKRGDYAAACPKLAESVRLKPTVGALAKLAACEEHESRLVSARTRWMQAENLARSIGDSRLADVTAELARIDTIVPKLTITATGALPSDVVLRVDDLVVGAASLGVPLAVEPGRHSVAVAATKKKPWSASVETKADGATTNVTIPALEDAPAEPAPAPPPAPPVAAPIAMQPRPAWPPDDALPSRDGSTMRTVGMFTAGAGVVAIGVGTFFGLEAIRKRSDAGCAGTTCPNDASASTLNDAKSAGTMSTVFFVAGGALAAVGVTLWLTAPAARTTQSARVDASPSLGGLVVRARW